MILLHIFKLIIFNYLFSFFAGLITLLPAFILSLFIREDKEPSFVIKLIGGLMGLAIVACQSLIISRATELSLISNPSRITMLWYFLGFVFCTPLALTQKRNQDQNSGILIFGSYIIYLIGIFTNIDTNMFIQSIAKLIAS